MDKKTIRKTFRVSRSLHDRCQKAGINVSFVCRSALLSELARTDARPDTEGKLHTLRQSAQIYNNHLSIIVQTLPEEKLQKIRTSHVKLPVFGHIMRQVTPDHLLPPLGDFLEGGEFSEELLSQVFLNDTTQGN